jgi:hypothetical protein
MICQECKKPLTDEDAYGHDCEVIFEESDDIHASGLEGGL